MHILFLTDNFPPEGNAPATRTYEHAIRWVRAGHKVTVVTCAPNFPEGKVFEGYKNTWYQRHDFDGINVVRVKTYITANEGFLKRILDYISFMITGFFAGLFQKKVDVIVATSPQFFCACAGWALSTAKRKPFVFELRDIWPASITAVGAMKDSFAIRILEKIELFLYRKANSIISVTHSFKDELIKRGINGEKIDVVLNGVDLTKYKPSIGKDHELERHYSLEGKFVAGYIGTHGMAHGLEHIVAVAERLQEHDDIRIVFAGGGAARQKVVDLVNERKLRNVILIERQPKEMMAKLWSVCDVSLVPLVNNPLFKTVIPSKIFECMGMGIPTIMSVPEGEATTIIRETGSGIVVESENVEQIADAILRMKNDKELYESIRAKSVDSAHKYSRDLMAKNMEAILLKQLK
ncbi:glycosyltransferase family 4 protein [Vibrio parahaemolyticus]|uniref:glycosyltransferase family 4 protein n=1 Tax=Vibrio parahaemolyticus TaxID=670 RepID=UPI001376393A|nr:glycosyltransferase family 4 protein [Vibrio parahaemolyticus]EGQ7916936.1 glycosyltransferase family 4 protein [Vibrio parahaemolyticus]EGQ9943837.1 glycosyltransferase family 4 protein [Vibrio parahaemolyticus]EHH3645741.1 glycosyltransferase family 4 protein [Vibrio parahaemolyticus]EHH3734903.1 glycosyltransferase family 4 protein [Vibrio parahaemolyticus]EHR1106867.1 glycosyltransferase family 4 protein [Vibrio parahaemolyticus]